ncbi:MAG: plastocyanin/azurin family copper-binding protein [Acidobacteriales bacterium]|nr:plastocyanin/azurin family copper-binding protein [Terriglobales bacterium]
MSTFLKVALLTFMFSTIVLVAQGADKTVSIRGSEDVVINSRIFANLRFSPGPVTIKSGDTVTWVDVDDTDAPHTITIANPQDLPKTFLDVLASCVPCDPALAGHFPAGPPVLVLDDGDGVFEDPGDSRLLFAGQSFSATINVAPGTTLVYLCVIHPWMQGTIEVK